MPIPAPGRIIDGSGDVCDCGRSAVKKHCPRCGSYNIWGRRRSGRWELDPLTKEKIFIPGYVCRRCSQYFAEDAPCAAPPIEEPAYIQQRRIRDFNHEMDRLSMSGRSGIASAMADGTSPEQIARSLRAEMRWRMSQSRPGFLQPLLDYGVDPSWPTDRIYGKVEEFLVDTVDNAMSVDDAIAAAQQHQPRSDEGAKGAATDMGLQVRGSARGAYKDDLLGASQLQEQPQDQEKEEGGKKNE